MQPTTRTAPATSTRPAPSLSCLDLDQFAARLAYRVAAGIHATTPEATSAAA